MITVIYGGFMDQFRDAKSRVVDHGTLEVYRISDGEVIARYNRDQWKTVKYSE